MLRTVFGVVTVILLVAIAGLLYVNYGRTGTFPGSDVLAGSNPPALPAAPAAQTPAPPALAPVPPNAAPASATPATPGIAAPARTQVAEEQPTAAPAKRTHVVQAGDTLWGISEKYYGCDHISKIAAANGIKLKDRIRVGQVLRLPDLPSVEKAAEPEQLANQKNAEPECAPQPPTLNLTEKKE